MSIEAENAIAGYESLNSQGNGKAVTDSARAPLISDVNGLKGILEALLFVAGEPLTLDRLVTVLEGSSRAEVRDAMSALQTDYAAKGRGLQVVEVAGGYQIATRVDCAPWIKRLEKVKAGLKLSRSAMETLAIIAYKQPLVRGEIEQIRGVDTAGVLRTLLDRRFVLASIAPRGRPRGDPGALPLPELPCRHPV